MISSKVAARSAASARALRVTPQRAALPLRNAAARGNIRQQARFQSTGSSTTSTAAQGGGSSALVGGLTGGAVVFILGYGYYYFSGAKSVVSAASTTKKQFDSLAETMKAQTPAPSEALQWFRQTVTQYSSFVPGAKPYVDSVFADLDQIDKNHHDELNKLVSSAYSEMRDTLKGGLSVETAQKSWSILTKYMEKIGELAADSANEILDNHPQIKEKVGDNLDELKKYAKSYGPEAKEQLDQTYSQIKTALAGGFSVETANKVQKIVQEKLDKVKQLGDQAWKKGMEQAKPYLDKNPDLKKIVEENAETLKKGDFGELYEKIKAGDVNSLKEYAQQAAQKVDTKSLKQYAKYIPGGEQILPKLGKLQEVAQKRGDDAQRILKETYDEVVEVLKKKTEEVEKLGEEVKKDAKK